MHELSTDTENRGHCKEVPVVKCWLLVEVNFTYLFIEECCFTCSYQKTQHGFLSTFRSTGTYPLDVVRRRMQMKGATGELFKYNSTWHAFNVIAKTEGIHGLFKGMWPNLLKVHSTYHCHIIYH